MPTDREEDDRSKESPRISGDPSGVPALVRPHAITARVTAREMNRTAGWAAGLPHRELKALRARLGESERP
jgi:hypothetical protein